MYGRIRYGVGRYGVFVEPFNRRVSQVLANAEYTGATNDRRISQVVANAEFTGATNERRVSQVLLMIEYQRAYMRARVQFLD